MAYKAPPVEEFKTELNDEEVIVFCAIDGGDPGSYYQPPEPASAEISSVMYKGIDVVMILSESQLEDLAEKCLALAAKEAEGAAESEAESRFESDRDHKCLEMEWGGRNYP